VPKARLGEMGAVKCPLGVHKNHKKLQVRSWEVAIDKRKERTHFAEPRLLTVYGAGPEVDTERSEGCTTELQEVVTAPQPGEPTIPKYLSTSIGKSHKEDPEQHWLKQGDTLAAKGVIARNQLRGSKKQGPDIIQVEPLARTRRNGEELPEVCLHHESIDVKLSRLIPPDLIGTNDRQSRDCEKSDISPP
jgi:hypothetical protein